MAVRLGLKLPCNTFGFVHFNHLQISHRPAESVRYLHAPLYVHAYMYIQGAVKIINTFGRPMGNLQMVEMNKSKGIAR